MSQQLVNLIIVVLYLEEVFAIFYTIFLFQYYLFNEKLTLVIKFGTESKYDIKYFFLGCVH